jgi:signal transduction histidine kinase
LTERIRSHASGRRGGASSATETANGRKPSATWTAPASRVRPGVAALAVLGLAVAAAASLYVLNTATKAPEANATVRAIMALTALGVGLYLWQRQPHNRYGLVLAAGVFVLSPMALAVSQDPWTFTIGRTVAAVAIVYAVFLALIFPDGRAEERGARLALAATVVGSAVLWTAVLVFADTLPAGGPLIPCSGDCPGNAAHVAETSPDLSEALGLAYGVFCAAIGLAVAALLLRRLRNSTPLGRRAIGPVLAVIVPVCIGMGAYIFVREVAPDSVLLDPLGWLVIAAFALFPFMISVGLIRGRVLAASALAELVERLRRERSPAGVEEAMREALRDPALELLFWSSTKSSYVDVRGGDVHLPDGDGGRSVTRIDRDREHVAAIVHDPALDSHPDSIRAVASAALMAMENARLEDDREAIVLEERRRIARDLHDGMAQDLAFITVHGRALAERHPRAEGIASAAQRALTDSRAAILALTGPADQHLASAVARTATGLADRSGIVLELEIDDEVDAEPETRSELLRILGEAISNATRHGKASKIHIRLSAEPALRLAISDDGCGFEAGGGTPPSNGGFGLTSMRERAEGLGGELRVNSRPGDGTEVEVVLP